MIDIYRYCLPSKMYLEKFKRIQISNQMLTFFTLLFLVYRIEGVYSKTKIIYIFYVISSSIFFFSEEMCYLVVLYSWFFVPLMLM